jgi:hypothetical protein
MTRENSGPGGSPTPNFSASPATGAAPLAVQFTNLTTNPLGSVFTWLWEFGDGKTSTEVNPRHVYEFAGSYDVTMTATVGTQHYGCWHAAAAVVSAPLPGTRAGTFHESVGVLDATADLLDVLPRQGEAVKVLRAEITQLETLALKFTR